MVDYWSNGVRAGGEQGSVQVAAARVLQFNFRALRGRPIVSYSGGRARLAPSKVHRLDRCKI